MLVYHSSDQCFTVPDVVHSREALDFGKGFYVTRLKEQALQNLVYEKPNHQLRFITQKAIDKCLKFVKHTTYSNG